MFPKSLIIFLGILLISCVLSGSYISCNTFMHAPPSICGCSASHWPIKALFPPPRRDYTIAIQFLESQEFSWVLHVTMKSEDPGLHLHCKTLRKWSNEELRKDIAYTGKDDIYLGSWQHHGTIYLQARHRLQFALWEVIVSISSPPSVHRLKSRAG